MTTIIIISLAALCALLLLRANILLTRQYSKTNLLINYCMAIFTINKYQSSVDQLVVWKCMNDMYAMKDKAANNENYELAEQYKIAIKNIETLMNYYRNNLENHSNEQN